MGLKLFEREPRGYNLHRKNNRKSKFRKWLIRILFLILLILLLLQFHHYDQAIDYLARLNVEQGNLINALDVKAHSLELSNANLQAQVDMMRVKINGIEMQNLHNQIQNQIHTVSPTEPIAHNVDVHSDLHNESKVNVPSIISPETMITTAAVTIITVLKGISSFIPALP